MVRYSNFHIDFCVKQINEKLRDVEPSCPFGILCSDCLFDDGRDCIIDDDIKVVVRQVNLNLRKSGSRWRVTLR